MQSHKELREQYEDALFALLMDDVARREGQQALDEMETLASDCAFSIPSDADQACRKTIRNYYAGSRYRTMRRLSFRILNKVAIIVLIAILALTTVFAASPTIRRTVLNYIVRTFDDHTEISFVAETDSENSGEIDFSVPWVPEGYELIETYADETTAWQIYVGPDNAELQITIAKNSNQSTVLNSEDGMVQEISINDMSGCLITQSQWKSLFLVNVEKAVTMEIYTFADSAEILLEDSQITKIAETIDYRNLSA